VSMETAGSACRPREAGTKLSSTAALPSAGRAQGQAYAPAPRAAAVVQDHMHGAGRMGKAALRCGRLQLQLQAAQIAMADDHAGGSAAGQQKSQQIAEIELVVDGRNQQHDQRGQHGPARARGQDVDIALGQSEPVAGRQARQRPAADAGGQGKPAGSLRRFRLLALAQGLLQAMKFRLHHGSQDSGTACIMARTCSTAPRPAWPTGTSLWAITWGSMAWTSSGAT